MALPAKPVLRKSFRAAPATPAERSAEPVRPLSSHSAEGDALLDEVRNSVATLKGLLTHASDLGESVAANIRATLASVEAKLEQRELCVVVVAERGAGMTTFLNALLGEPLLPTTQRKPKSIRFLRRGPRQRYVAHRANGALVDFEKLHPDPTKPLEERLAACKAEIARASSEREQRAAELTTNRDAAQRAQGVLKDKFNAFEAARAEAEALGREIGEVETERLELKRRAAEYEEALPNRVRTRPPVWAIWLWVIYAVLLLVSLKTFRLWQKALHELEALRARTSRLQLSASEAALKCRQAEAAIEPLASPAESAQASWISARKQTSELDAELERLRRDAESLEAELNAQREQQKGVFFAETRELCDPDARGKDVLELEITYPATYLPDDVAIVDTPGVTDDSKEAQDRAWQVIREKADGCILVSELESAVSGPTKTFLQRVREIVPHVLLVLTKMDVSFIEAMRRRAGEPWEHVEQARRVATRRFAREIGREPGSVLSVSIAAEAVLRESERTGLVRRFEAEIAKLFQLLRHERALILGSRAATAVRRCIESVGEARERAERLYQQRIAALEEHQRPDPERFRNEQVNAAQPAVLQAAAEVTHAALESLRASMEETKKRAAERVFACKSKQELVALVPELERLIKDGVDRTLGEVGRVIDSRAEAAVERIELGFFESLRLRYEIAHLVTRASSPALQLEPVSVSVKSELGLGATVERAAESFKTLRIGLGIGGSAAGLIVGTLLLPGVGTAVGAAAGALLSFARTLGSLKRQCLRAVDGCLAEPEQALAQELRDSEAEVARALSRAVDESMKRAIARFEQWISEPLEADRAALEKQHHGLKDLQALRDRLFQNSERLELVIDAAIASSRGLCG